MDQVKQAMEIVLGAPENLTRSIVVIALVAVALFINQKLFKTRIKTLEASQGPGNRLSRILRIVQTSIRYLIIAVGLVTILAINGVDIAAIATAAGAASIILGFALKDLLEDFAMGARIITDNYFKVGDSIKVGDDEGVVISMTPQSTKIKNFADDSISTISNRNLQRVTVLGDFGDIDIGLPYDLPAKKAQEVISAACERIKLIDDISDAQFKGTVKFDDSAIVYKLRIWCKPQQRPQSMRDARGILQEALEAEGISCPFPQLDIHSR